MDDEGNVVDLSPRDYEVTAGKHREPFLAPGWKYGLFALFTLLAIRVAFVMWR